MKVVFLDIDGVLNNDESWRIRQEYIDKYHKPCSSIDELTVKRLSEIVNATKSKVVLSSYRRSDWKDGIENIKIWQSKELQKLFDKYNIEILGITPCIPRTNDPNEKYTSWREYEINYYLDTHPEIDIFCVIDDEIKDLHTLEDYLVKTDTRYGLVDEDVPKAIEILTCKKLHRSNRNGY